MKLEDFSKIGRICQKGEHFQNKGIYLAKAKYFTKGEAFSKQKFLWLFEWFGAINTSPTSSFNRQELNNNSNTLEQHSQRDQSPPSTQKRELSIEIVILV
jgi:hypothetical protein